MEIAELDLDLMAPALFEKERILRSIVRVYLLFALRQQAELHVLASQIKSY